MISFALLESIAGPLSNPSLAASIAKELDEQLPAIGVTGRLRVAHFLAQAAHETAAFRTLHEFWGPTAAQQRYEGRADLGNKQTGDGHRFLGRGIFQITGRSNYEIIGEKLGLDLLSQPELAEQPQTAVMTACEFWRARNLNALADLDDLISITRKINGGLNGLSERRRYLDLAKGQLS